MSTIRAVIKGTGSYLPEKILTNKDLEKIVDTSDEWITQRSGIKSRRIAGDDETTSMMATRAAQRAMEAAGVTAADIDGIVVATTTPDLTFPSVAVMVQAALGIAPCVAFDVQAVCAGFMFALTTADNFIKVGQAKRVLVIGADKMSSILNWEDRMTCVLFADGAGAVVLEAQEGEGDLSDHGVLSTRLYSNGEGVDLLKTAGGPSSTGCVGKIEMQGREVFKNAVTLMAQVVDETLEHHGIDSSEIDFLVPHQANSRIIEATAKKLGMDMDQVVMTVDHHGNTSGASIPLALDEAVREGKIQKGHLLLLEALGGGLTWGAALVRY